MALPPRLCLSSALGEAAMIPNPLKSRRVQFWAAFGLIAALCFAMAISGRIRRYHAGQSAERLRQLLAADARFTKVQVHCSTNARVWLDGEVASADDLSALRRLVEQAHVPTQPGVFVRVQSPAPNKPASGDTAFQPLLFLANQSVTAFCRSPGV